MPGPKAGLLEFSSVDVVGPHGMALADLLNNARQKLSETTGQPKVNIVVLSVIDLDR